MNTSQSTGGVRPRLLALAAATALASTLLLAPPPAPATAKQQSCAKRGDGKPRSRRCRARAPKSKQPGAVRPSSVVPPRSSDPAPVAVAPPRPSPGQESPAAGGDAPPLPTPQPAPAPPPGGSAIPLTLFAAGPWRAPVAATDLPDPESDRLIQTLLARLAAEQAAGTGPRLGTDTRTPLYRVGPDQPTVPVHLHTGPWGDRLAARFLAGVPIPSDAQAVAGSDRAMAVWQPATDTYWEFFKMQQSLPVPQFLGTAAVTTGCALPHGTYTYGITAVSPNGETNPPAGGVSAAVSADGGCIGLRWRGISGAIAYRIYRGAEGSPPTYLATVAPPLTSFEDDGSAVPDGTPAPTANNATTPGEWHASYGGVITEVTESPGYYRDRVGGGGEVLEQSNWGSAATATPLAAGLITKEDVERGSIDHAVAIGLDNSGADAILRAGQFAFPAQGTDGKSSAPDSIPEGARLVLDPSLDVSALGLPPLARMLAEAAQTYGLIVQDGSMSTVVYAEDPAPYVRAGQPNFYRPLVGSSSVRALRSFPWEDLEVANMHLCVRHPCLLG